MIGFKSALLALFLSTNAMAALNETTPSPKDFNALPATEVMLNCDPTYVSMAKQVSGLTMMALAATFQPEFHDEADKVTQLFESMKTCEDFQHVYKSTLDLLTKMGIDFEAYLAEDQGQKELNEVIELIRQLAAERKPKTSN